MKSPLAIVVQLIHIHGPLKGDIQEFSVETISIGRNPGSSVCFPVEMTSLSRRHAEIVREGNQFKLTDFSTNGTFVNGKKVTEAFLKDGDVLEFSEGGPKVSFLTRITDTPVEIKKEIPVMEAVREPVAQTPVSKETPRVHVAEPPPYIEEIPSPSPEPSPESFVNVRLGGEKRVELSAQKVSVPLVIQYGPAIRSFRELPIILGANPRSDFVLSLPSILDQHMQILFSHGQYWIKDLSGQNQIRINDRAIDFQAPLDLNDIISLTPQGPVFCFLGEGRLAEVAEIPSGSPSAVREQENAVAKKTGTSEEKSSGSLWSKLKNKF
ncbi:MAG: FHA domain-containing protein [Desulfuromonadales bacterium]|nr:FHA domain-containing protein [Desulfuromonadales bacterium]